MTPLSIWSLLPFALMLAGIALAPVIVPRLWEKERVKAAYSLALTLPMVAYLTIMGYGDDVTNQMLYDYMPFVVLVGTLYVVTGGINIVLNLAPSPRNNATVLLAGFVLSSIMGTTGASLLLIRPLLAMNEQRRYKAHMILFFVALVANCGGLLTPLGDPPLFMLFLRGVPFGWFLNLFPSWLFMGIVMLAIYFVIDCHYYKKEDKSAMQPTGNGTHVIILSGIGNIVLLIAVVLCVAFINSEYIPAMGHKDAPLHMKFLRETLLVIIASVSWFSTRKSIRRANDYTWEPLNEIAILFIGVFATMTPALIFLRENAAHIALHSPAGFYYATGILSSFLDNTPTTVAFYTLATDIETGGVNCVAGIEATILAAISTGAVFFGSMTYIGNGPNLMVKSIAEHYKVKMPSFFGYMLRFALPLLLPLFILVQLLFIG